MKESICPECGNPLDEGVQSCNRCGVEIDWEADQPVVSMAGRALGRVAIVTVIAVIAAALVLAGILFAIL